MIKTKSIFVCANCGYKSPRWQGKCPDCGQWNTFEEQSAPTGAVAKALRGTAAKTIKLSDVKEDFEGRIISGISEFDMVLGGGIVPGSLVLLGGDPGIGKSTLALQAALLLNSSGRSVIYVSGEESAQQIKSRSHRLGLGKKTDLSVLAETNLETIVATLSASQPDVVIMDSIQTLNSEQVNGVVGGVSQLSFSTNTLLRLAKEQHIAILLIGHVTKEGMLAGPKTIEHMVDTVLYLEGDRFGNLRLLRSSKNRFGSIGEVGVFDMKESGLEEVPNPSAMFLEHREKPLAGSCITAALEGNKVLLLEIQALTSTSSFGYPKRATSGFDNNRLQLLAAILQKSLNTNLSNQDIFVNVAGGFQLDERAVDLPVCLAVLSSFHGIALPADTLAFGEVGLLGEIRGVSQIEKRLKECEKLGFKRVFVGGSGHNQLDKKFPKLKINYIRSLAEVMELFKHSK